jgi:hypothetical protein
LTAPAGFAYDPLMSNTIAFPTCFLRIDTEEALLDLEILVSARIEAAALEEDRETMSSLRDALGRLRHPGRFPAVFRLDKARAATFKALLERTEIAARFVDQR